MPVNESEAVGLPGTIERFEGTSAVITLRDGQTVRWPIQDLPKESGVGAEVRLVLKTSASDQEDREQLAKSILNEILRGNDGKKSR